MLHTFNYYSKMSTWKAIENMYTKIIKYNVIELYRISIYLFTTVMKRITHNLVYFEVLYMLCYQQDKYKRN